MKIEKHIAVLLAIAFICIFAGCQQKEIRLPSLKETYAKEDKKPFGGFVAFQQLRAFFPDNYIQATYEPFTETWNDNYLSDEDEAHSLYILITKDLFLKENDASSMLEFIKAGNDLFLSSDYIDPDFLTLIECYNERKDEVISEVNGVMKNTAVKVASVGAKDFERYRYFYYPMENYFSGFDLEKSRVLGWTESGRPNYIVMFIGKGRLYFHSAPRTFSNYFLLTKNNHEYLAQLMGYMRPEPKYIYWDEYYKFQHMTNRKQKNTGGGGYGGKNNKDKNGSGNDKPEFSSFNVINEHEELQWAFWLGLFLLFLFALFNMKRKQRIIPKIDPNTNTTVAFTETVGRLYLQKKNNKNISDKMITYFFDHLRNTYFLSTTQVNNDFTHLVSRKSGVPIGQIETLFSTINSVQASEKIEDFQLLSLNEQIQNFYKNKTDGRKHF